MTLAQGLGSWKKLHVKTAWVIRQYVVGILQQNGPRSTQITLQKAITIPTEIQHLFVEVVLFFLFFYQSTGYSVKGGTWGQTQDMYIQERPFIFQSHFCLCNAWQFSQIWRHKSINSITFTMYRYKNIAIQWIGISNLHSNKIFWIWLYCNVNDWSLR